MPPIPETPPGQDSVLPPHSGNDEKKGDVGTLLHSALGTTRATFALASAEARLAYKSIWSFGFWVLAAFLFALTSWWLLCALIVVGAYALGVALPWSLGVLLLLHLSAIFFIVRFVRDLIANIGFAQTRAQLAAIAQAVSTTKSPPTGATQ